MSKTKWSLLIFVGMILLIWLVVGSPSFESCVNDQQNTDAKDAFQKIVSNLLIYRRCIGPFLHTNEGGITALSTVVIAIFTAILGAFTVSLAKATKIAADAAKESADAAVSVEGALLLIRPKFHTYWEVAGKFGALYPNSPDMGHFSHQVTAEFDFRNYGKTAAIILDASVRLHFGESEPSSIYTPKNLLELPNETVLISGANTQEFSISMDSFLDMRDAIAINAGEKSIWLVGYTIYADIFNRTCEGQFLFKFNPRQGRYIRIYEKNIRKKQKPKS